MDRNQTGNATGIHTHWVALRKESVDRNLDTMQVIVIVMVALRKESVDRNSFSAGRESDTTVALRKESVDRNNGDNGKIKQSN